MARSNWLQLCIGVAGQLFELADHPRHSTATLSQSHNIAISLTLLRSAIMAASTGKKSIVFVHPDLGIGGAERLVIDAAVGLQSSGHKVTILTSYRDTKHCFDEARDGRWALDWLVKQQALRATWAKYHSRNTRCPRAWRQHLSAVGWWTPHDSLRYTEADCISRQHQLVFE
jgi:hypothetical protein